LTPTLSKTAPFLIKENTPPPLEDPPAFQLVFWNKVFFLDFLYSIF
jgi:hypothetical protein